MGLVFVVRKIIEGYFGDLRECLYRLERCLLYGGGGGGGVQAILQNFTVSQHILL